MMILALLGYTIIPDKTSFANSQYLEISRKSPGFSTYFYHPNKKKASASFFSMLINGQSVPDDSFPIKSYEVVANELVIIPYDKFKSLNGSGIIIPIQLNKTYKTQEEWLNKHLNKRTFWMGTDRFGRDVLSRVIIGLRVSLSVGIVAVLISLIVGVVLGALSGYYGGLIDRLIMWFINVIWSLPSLLLIIAISFALGKGFWQMFIAIGLSIWVEVARVVRGQVMSVKQNEYIEAARALAYSHTRIITKHILPNIWGPVIVISVANFSTAILIEAGLSFLGLGVAPPVPSLGGMIRENYAGVFFGYPWLSVFPGLIIVTLVLSLMILGRALKKHL